MALAAANKTSGKDETDLSTYLTPSIAFLANRLYIFTFGSHGPGPTTVTATGTGLTIPSIATDTVSGIKRLTVFRAMPTSDTTTTVSFASLGPQVQSHGFWSIEEYDGMDTSGTNGEGAIVQSGTITTTGASSLTVTLAAFGNANNAAFGAFLKAANENMTEGAGFTPLAEVTGAASPTTSILTEHKINDNTVDCSWASSGTAIGIAVEIKAASLAPPRKLRTVSTPIRW